MASYLLQCLIRTKKWVWVGVVIAVLCGIFALTLNHVVRKFIPSYISIMADRLKVKVSFQTVRYGFPRQIILKKVQIFDTQAPSKPMMEIPLLRLRFAFPLLASHDKIHLAQIELDSMVLRAPSLKNYIAHHGALLWSEFRIFPRSDIKISLNNSQLFLFNDADIVAPIVFNIDFALSKGKLTVKFKDNRSFLQCWGHWQGNGLDWKGFVFYDGPLSQDPMYILDINGRGVVKNKGVFLEKLSFSINGNQFLATGYYLMDDPFAFEADISYSKPTKNVSVQDPSKDVDLKLYGELGPKNVAINGAVSFEVNAPLQKGSLVFQGLQARIINDELLKLSIKHAQGLLWTEGEHRISLDHFIAGIRRQNHRQWMAALSTELYGGKYQGQIAVDTKSAPWQIQARGQLEGLQINRLSEMLAYFDKCQGNLSGTLDVQAPKNLLLSGTVSMKEGSVADFSFLPWAVAKIFQMPSLDHLSGADLSLRFKMDQQTASVEDLKLHSDDLDLKGFFRKDINDLVSSRISILFSQKIMNESPIGQKVMRLVPQAWSMPFEFHLSGDMNRMNFQWDDSLLKRKVESRLPNFIERSIEHNMNEKLSI